MADHKHQWQKLPKGKKRCYVCGQRRGPVQWLAMAEALPNPRTETDESGLAGKTKGSTPYNVLERIIKESAREMALIVRMSEDFI